ncbi:MAG: hypothetical protein UR98_C0040G0029 [Parcubacteria group bacterium GW2011_GWA1_36_12]|nr:MAG: hypothetical protein UR98_C0040G0029 [Parcubacteria group bacterium GW2011_GWA1_36_12]
MVFEKVVVVGGGTGTYTILRGLKKYPLDLTAVVSMADDGGSTGILRDEYGILPPGDVRRCLVALSESSEIMKKLFEYRFSKGSMQGHSFGNLFLTAIQEVVGDYNESLKETSKLLNVRGKVVPVTLDKVRLCAELENGQNIIGETNIDVPRHDPSLKIKKVYLKPQAMINRDAYDAIVSADKIIIGPGDLYTSVIPNLIVKGFAEALKQSSAKKIYVCNLMTKHGETNGFSVTDFVSAINSYVDGLDLDYVVYHDGLFDGESLARYALENASPVFADVQNFASFKSKFISGNFTHSSDLIRHDSDAIASCIVQL